MSDSAGVVATRRLVLRPFRPDDRAALVAMYGDAATMAQLAPVRSPSETDAAVARHEGYRPTHGLGFWVVTLGGVAIGHCGLKPGAPDTPIAGDVEIGWIVARAHWRNGYAFEAASAALDWAWHHRAEDRVVAITSEGNAASRALMTRLGLRHLVDRDFDHPLYADDPARRRTVVYAVDRPR